MLMLNLTYMMNLENFKAYIESDGEIDFDIYAQDPNEWAELSEIIPGLIVSSAGGICPFQSEGLLHGLPYYLKERGGWISLRVGQTEGNAFSDVLYAAGMEYKEFADISYFEDMLIKLVPLLKPASFRWEFEAKKLEWDEAGEWTGGATDEIETQYGWGNTPEEALLQIQEISEYLVEAGMSAEMQVAMNKARQINPIPINEDNRVWPEEMPNFVVNL